MTGTSWTNTPDLFPVRIIDVTGREGVQAAGVHLSPFSRLVLLAMLARTGISEAEIGFPCLDHEKPFLKAAMALKETGALGSLTLSGWCRATCDDVDAAIAACPDLDGLNLSVSVSDRLIGAKFQGRKSWSDVATGALAAAARAKDLGINTVTFNMEDASRAPLERVLECCRLAGERGADRVRYCDTVGIETPIGIHERVRCIATQGTPPLTIHCHNDTGMAVACALSAAQAALEEGVEPFVDVTVNGVGERAGNASLVTFLLALRSAFSTVVRDGRLSRAPENGPNTAEQVENALREASRTSRYAAMETGSPIPAREPGIGEQVFRHSSGIHVDGLLKAPGTYEPFEPLAQEAPGSLLPVSPFVLGPYSGEHALRHVYGQLGCELSRDEGRFLLPLVQRVTRQIKRHALAGELLFLRRHAGIVAELLAHEIGKDPGVSEHASAAGFAC